MAVINSQTSELIRSLRMKGLTTQAIAKHLKLIGVTPSLRTVRRHCRHAVVEKKKNHTPRKLTSQVMEIIDSILKMDDVPARKVKALLLRRHNINISLCSVRKAVRRLGWKFGKPTFVPMTRDKIKETRASSPVQPRTAERLVNKKEAFVGKVVQPNVERCDNEKDMVVHLRNLLAQRVAELAAAENQQEALRAENETLLANIASLRADLGAMKAENQNLREENQRLKETSHSECQRRGQALIEEVRAGFGELQAAIEQETRNVPATSVRPIPSSTSTPESAFSQAEMSPLSPSFTFNNSIQIPCQHPDVSLSDVGPNDHARIRQQSNGQVGRYGCLLFKSIISDENYKAWCKTTNWDGSRGKQELPQNIKNFVIETLKRQFPGVEMKDLKDCIYKINEFLRTPRKSSSGLTML